MEKPTLAIYVPAHNEALNIARFLDSVLAQDTTHIQLSSITVVCDGCTDRTAAIVAGYARADSRIKVINDGKRMGKLARMNDCYREATADIIAVFDADVVLLHRSVLSELVRPFSDDRVGVVGGVEVPAQPTTFWQKIAVTWTAVWYDVRRRINAGDSVHNLAGCVYALKKNFYRSVVIPEVVVADDEFLYFKAREEGVRFVFAPRAMVQYNCPANFSEYVQQSSRYINTKHRIVRHFGSWVEPHYRIPFQAKVRALVGMWFRTPLWLTVSLLFQAYLRLFKLKTPYADTAGLWDPASSTK